MHYRKPFEFSAYHTQSMCKEAIDFYVAKPRYQTTETITSNINPTLVSTQFQTYVWLYQALEFDLWLAADVLVHDEVMCLFISAVMLLLKPETYLGSWQTSMMELF